MAVIDSSVYIALVNAHESSTLVAGRGSSKPGRQANQSLPRSSCYPKLLLLSVVELETRHWPAGLRSKLRAQK